MSTGNTVGLPVPKLLPITGTACVPLVLLSSLLSFNVGRERRRNGTMMGSANSGTSQSTLKDDPLHTATRMHLNFLENVPFAMILSASVELNGGNRKWLSVALAALTGSRLCHAIALHNGYEAPLFFWMRVVGYWSTLAIQIGMGGWAGWLCKGYWDL